MESARGHVQPSLFRSLTVDALFADSPLLAGLWSGFQTMASTPELWLLVLFGVILGMSVGVLPGFGPPAAMALLFPLVYVVEPLPGISLLAGIFYGAKYGGAVTSILIGIPGEADAVATLFDGHPLALGGKAKQALAAATLASFTGGITAALGIVLLAPVLSGAALSIGPSGRALLMAGALLLVALTSPGSFRRSLCMVFLGLALALPGMDPVYGSARFTFGNWHLSGGVELTSLLLGVFGLGDLLEPPPDLRAQATQPPQAALPGPGVSAVLAALRGSLIGFLTGLIPCGAGVTASFASRALEKKLSRMPERFGKGAWEGLTGPEASNNAAAMASFGPLLLLGLPTNPIMAAMLGALTIGGVIPGPALPQQQPEFYWGLFFCLLLGNVFLLGLGLCLSGLWAGLAALPPRRLRPFILMLCLIGSYIGADGPAGPVQCLTFGLLSLFLKRKKYPLAPMVLAFVLGPRLETHLMQAFFSFW